MNANEIAEQLDEFEKIGGDIFFGTAADVLRSLNERNDALEKQLQLNSTILQAAGAQVRNVIATIEQNMQPLTDEELIGLFTQAWDNTNNANGIFIRFARKIEERHGIK